MNEMARSNPLPAFDSLLSFYREAFSETICHVSTAGRTGTMLLETRQTRGDWSDPPVADLVLTFTLSPVSGDMQFGGKRRHRRIAAGDFVLVPPLCRTTFLLDQPHRLRFAALPYARLLALSGQPGALPADGDFGPLHDAPMHDRSVAKVFEALWRHGGNDGAGGALQADGLILQLLGSLLDLRHGEGARRKPTSAALTPRQLARLKDHMEAHSGTDVQLADLAALVDLSPEHLCRAFKAETGLPPYAWLMRRRIEKAQELMRAHPDMGLTEIALAVGYSGQGPFGAAFRRVTGARPSEWRKTQA